MGRPLCLPRSPRTAPPMPSTARLAATDSGANQSPAEPLLLCDAVLLTCVLPSPMYAAGPGEPGRSPGPHCQPRDLMAPAMVARFLTSSIGMPRSFAARSSPFAVAWLTVAPVPMTEIALILQTLPFPTLSPRLWLGAVPRPTETRQERQVLEEGKQNWPLKLQSLRSSTCRVTMPETSVVCPAISPSPCMACMSPCRFPRPEPSPGIQDSACSDCIAVHVRIRALMDCRFVNAVAIWRTQQAQYRISGIVHARHLHCRGGPRWPMKGLIRTTTPGKCEGA